MKESFRFTCHIVSFVAIVLIILANSPGLFAQGQSPDVSSNRSPHNSAESRPNDSHDRLSQSSQEIPNTQSLEIPFTSPAEALAGIKLPEGFSATLFAAEPDIHQPIAITTDARGRLWVVECYTYSDRKKNYDTQLNDRIVIFEDTNHDGKFDERTIFWDEGKKLTGIEVGMGGVWVTCAPKFMFIPDRNQDDVPDGPPEVLLDGFEDDVIRHNIVNGLRWGPDGWLYGRHGIQATSFVGPPGSTDSQRTAMNCSIWRYHPTHHKFEIVAQGGTNAWGFDYDENGEMFFINTVIGHLFHVVPGARYRRMYGAHFNPYTYQIIEQTADHFHWDTSEEHWAVTKKEGMSNGTDAAGGGHAHTGLMIYQGGKWPAKYHNSLLTANFHGRRLNVDTVAREGNSYVGHHAPDFMKTSDPWFRGVELIYGNDGNVFLLDWSDIGECHENDGIHRTSGRIFKLCYGEQHPPAHADLNQLDDDQLIALQKEPNQWYVRTARRLLQQRSVDGDAEHLSKLILAAFEKSSADNTIEASARDRFQLRMMWTLYSIGGANQKWLLEQTKHSNEHIRAWAVRLLTDGLEPVSSNVASAIARMSADDQSGLVRLYAASSVARMTDDQKFKIIGALCQHGSDANDRVQPHMIWFGIEPAVVRNYRRALKLAKTTKIPLIRVNIIRRLTEEMETDPSAEFIAQWLAEEAFRAVDAKPALLAHSDPEILKDLLAGMSAALQGWENAPAPENWDTISKRLANILQSDDNTESKNQLQQLDVVFGSGRALDQLRNLVGNNNADTGARRKAIELLAAKLPAKEVLSVLQPLISNKSLTEQVTKSLVHSDSDQTAKIILKQYRKMQPAGKIAAVNTLISRDAWAFKLLDTIEEGNLPRDSINAWHARQMKNFQNTELDQRIAQVWGEVRDSTDEKLLQMESVKKIVGADISTVSGSADISLKNGHQLYVKNCASCHTIFGQGGKIGPDLTGSDRKNLNYLLQNIIDPSASVAESYQASLFQLNDGRLVSGVVIEENERTVKLQSKDELLVIDLKTVEDRRRTKLSLMPDGLIDNLSAQEVTDLFNFLRSN